MMETRHETSEELRRSLKNLRLHPGTSGSDYVNKFRLYTNDLNSIPDEAMPISALTSMFLRNIKDPSYTPIVEQLRFNNASLSECINQIRRKEREIIQSQREARLLKTRARRTVENKDNNKVKNWPKTPKGYISIPPHEYKDLSDEEKDMIREYNTKHRESMKREGENTGNQPKRQKLPPEARTVYRIPAITETDTSGDSREPDAENNKAKCKKKIRFNIGVEGEEPQE